jgi:hypothetical protein
MAKTKLPIEVINATGTPSASTFLRGDKTWATPTGGSAAPAGSDTQIQFNSSGTLGASSDFTWDDVNNT